MKICFEGPSGVGKTTISQILSSEYLIIPEVIQLFKDEINEGGLWYYRKQVERYQLGKSSTNVIFDGDIFQPIWYNWSYNYPQDYLPHQEVHAFYKQEIENGNIKFPDLYILLQATEEQLRERKKKDKTRNRGNFEKHLKLLKTQPKYFGRIKQQFPKLVEIIKFDTLAQVESEVRKVISNRGSERYDSIEILNSISDWIINNRPDNG